MVLCPSQVRSLAGLDLGLFRRLLSLTGSHLETLAMKEPSAQLLQEVSIPQGSENHLTTLALRS